MGVELVGELLGNAGIDMTMGFGHVKNAMNSIFCCFRDIIVIRAIFDRVEDITKSQNIKINF